MGGCSRCGDAPQWTGAQQGCRPGSVERDPQRLQSLPKAVGQRLPCFLEEKTRGRGRGRKQNITATGHTRKVPKAKGLAQATPHSNPTNMITKRGFPKCRVFMHHLHDACHVYLLSFITFIHMFNLDVFKRNVQSLP